MRKLQHRISAKLFTVLLTIFLALPMGIFLVQDAPGVQGAASSIRYTIYEMEGSGVGWSSKPCQYFPGLLREQINRIYSH